MDNCIFCKIIAGEIPSFKVAENNEFLAFLSIEPINPGHTLIIPKTHGEYLFDESDEVLSKIMVFGKPVAKKLAEKLKPKTGKVGVIVAGLEVLHSHIHLIPMDAERDLTFVRVKSASSEELQKTLDNINS